MLTYSSFSERLALGQLKNTGYVGKDSSGAILEKYVDDILIYTNQGLIDITTRKKVLTGYVDLIFENDVRLYPLTDNASYLSDVDDDVFKSSRFVSVHDIFDSKGVAHSVDTNGHITTPSYDTLRFTESFVNSYGPKVRIRYQKLHDNITASKSIDLPPALITALQLYVAGLALAHLNGKDHTESGNRYYGRYLAELGEDTNNNSSSISEVYEDTKLHDKGFV